MQKLSTFFLKTLILYLLSFIYLLFTVEFSDNFPISSSFELSFYSLIFFALFLSIWVFFLNFRINNKLIAIVVILQVISLRIAPEGAWAPIGVFSIYFVVSFLFLYFCTLIVHKIFNKVLINEKKSYVLIFVCVPLVLYIFSLTLNEYVVFENEAIFRKEIKDYPYENVIKYISNSPIYLQNCVNYSIPFRKKSCEDSVKMTVKRLQDIIDLRENFELKYKDLLKNPINKGFGEEVSAGGFTLCNGVQESFGDYVMNYSSVRNHEPNYISQSGSVLTDEVVEIRYSKGDEWEDTVEVKLFRSSPDNKANPYYHKYDLFEERFSSSSTNALFKDKREFNSIIVFGHKKERQEVVEDIGNTILDTCENQPVMIVKDTYRSPDGGFLDRRHEREFIY